MADGRTLQRSRIKLSTPAKAASAPPCLPRFGSTAAVLLMALVVEWSWAGRLDGSGGRFGAAVVRFG